MPAMSSMIDKTKALEQIGGDEQLLCEVARIFLEELPGWRSELRASIAKSDAQTLRRIAHTIKGSVDVFGAAEAREAAAKVETMGETNRWDGVDEAVGVLNGVLDRLLPDLEKLAKRA